MADTGPLFNNILLGGRSGQHPGQLRIHVGGFIWKKQGGGKVVEVSKVDLAGLWWTRIPRGYQLGLRLKAGSNVKFNGFREQDVQSLNDFMASNLDVTPENKQLAIAGRNWGEAKLDGNMLSFVVGDKHAFEVSIADVSQTQISGKNDVVLEFHVDDTTGANEKDTLMEMSFHVPNTNATYVGDEERPSAEVFHDKIMAMADVGPSGAEAIATFEEVGILTPRGKYNVEFHISFLRLQGANDFKIQYSSIVRLFLLPKSTQPFTFVVITLDPPIRKGQTFYPHIVLQFPTEETTECPLSISEELLNTKYKDRLQSNYKGQSHEVFTQILRGLSGSKISRPGKFRSSQEGFSVRASLKAEEGTLYPLEKSFFFLPKPPTLVLHDEIEYVEFERHGAAGATGMSSHYFDLILRLKSEQEHQFRNIQRNEYHNLFNFISSKNLKILNLGDTQGTGGVVAALASSDDEGHDPHLTRIRNAQEAGGDDSDEEDEDFVAEKDDSGSPTDASEDEGSDASAASHREEDEERPSKVEKKKEGAPRVPAAKSKRKAEDEGDSGKKKKRKKKDPNAPKRPLTSFMTFSQEQREVVKKTTPSTSFQEMGKILGDKWKKMTAKEREPYEAKAKLGKERYQAQMAAYKSAGGASAAPEEDGAGTDDEASGSE